MGRVCIDEFVQKPIIKKNHYENVRRKYPYLEGPHSLPERWYKQELRSLIEKDPAFVNHRKRTEHVKNHKGRIRTVLEKFRSSPVVAINPTNKSDSNHTLPRHKTFRRETDLYKTSTGSNYGAILPRNDEIGPSRRRESAVNYEPTSHYGIHREFSQLGRTLGPDFGTYRNHSFNSTIDKSETKKSYTSQTEKHLITGPRQYLYSQRKH